MRRIAVASKLCIDRYYPDALVCGSKHNSTHDNPGGAAVTVAFVLRTLGFAVRLLGRYTDNDMLVRQRAIDAGIEWAMTRADGNTAINAVLPSGPTVLRVVSGPEYVPAEPDSFALTEVDVSAMAIGGSLDRDYVAMLLEFAAATGVPCFWNPGASADLAALDCGGEVYLQVSFIEFSQRASSPEELCHELLETTHATGVVVTDAAGGAYGIQRQKRGSFHVPAVSLLKSVRPLGAGDAHFAGFIAMFLNAPKCIRFERALGFARIVAAQHVSGCSPTGWSGIREFVNDRLQVADVRSAA